MKRFRGNPLRFREEERIRRLHKSYDLLGLSEAERMRRSLEHFWGYEDIFDWDIDLKLVIAFLIVRRALDEAEKRKQAVECEQTASMILNDLLYDLGHRGLDYPRLFDKKLKEAIKRRDDYRCQNPGCKGDVVDVQGLVIHHIDYNKRNCDPRNLITLCGACNVFANAYRGEWKWLYRKILHGRKVPRFVRTG